MSIAYRVEEPNYLSGAKLSVPMGKKITTYFYIFNGWQVIQDNNDKKAFGTQVEYRPNDKLLINWNTFLGDERSIDKPTNRMRYFTDIYAIYSPSTKFSFTSCAYIGIQNRQYINSTTESLLWWQANFIGSWKFSDKVSLAGRIEYFKDDKGAILNAITGKEGFETWSFGSCLNISVFGNAMFRLDGRLFSSQRSVFFDESQNLSNTAGLLTGNITVWF